MVTWPTARGRGAVVALASAAMVLGACGAPAVQVTASPVAEAVTSIPSATTPPPSPSTPPTPTPTPTPTPQQRMPLTGEPVDDARLDQPVMAVKIDNTPAAFPHTAIERADVVYEQVVEGGLTRLVPLFHSDIPDVIGPIRSARLMDVDLLSPFTPMLVFAGGRPEVASALADSGAIGMVSDRGGAPFFRDRSRSSPHNLYVDGPAVYEVGATREEVGPVSTSFEFGDPPQGGSELDSLDIAMTYWQTTSWNWDAEDEVYRRFTRGDPYQVTGDGRVGAANVLVVLTTVSQLRSGDPYMQTELIGEGGAVLLRDGRRYDIRWRKADTESHMEFVYADGTPVPLAVGQTWVHLAPIGAVG
ncbi:MAG TPA: DUF3048 domain-containing protein [Nitriliruptoraceae bacterium]|nr:DUF3048 domain-containing protein [Nitriliruptoraceae bacterium]